jgi:putative ABC transport system ATP-binding protein
MLRLKGITKKFSLGMTKQLSVLDGISLEIAAGDFTILLGSNGAGKSTLLKIIAGDLLPDSGEVMLDNESITALPSYKRSLHIGYIRQNSQANLPSRFTVLESFMLALTRSASPFTFLLRRKWEREIVSLLANFRTGLADHLNEQIVSLSGGEHQLISMLIASEAIKGSGSKSRVLLLDEHVAHLDPASAKIVMELTARLVQQYGFATLMVTHNIQIAAQYGDRILVLKDCKIAFDGKCSEGRRHSAADLLEIVGA